MFNEEKDYDEYGKWIRDYEDMDVPFEELALPRNEEEKARYKARFGKDTWKTVKAIIECGDPRIEEEIEEVLNDLDEYYNSEEFQQITKKKGVVKS